MANDNCNCGHDHNEEFDTITISLEGGEETKCNVIGVFDVEEKTYIALVPVDGDEIMLYGYNELENETIELKDIETDEEYDKVADALQELFEDVEFEDEDFFDDEDLDDDDFDDLNELDDDEE